MNNYINCNYSNNIRLISKNNQINNVNNFNPEKLKKSNSLNIPFSNGNGGPIKLKNKILNNKCINRILTKPMTPDLDNKINNNKNHYYNINNYPKHEIMNNQKNLVNNNINNINFKRPSTKPKQDKKYYNIKYNYDRNIRKIKKNNNDIGQNNSFYESKNMSYFQKRMPSPMIDHQRIIIYDKSICRPKYRAPSPNMISLSLGKNNYIKKIK